MDLLTYLLFRSFIVIFAVIPFRLLFGFADFLFYIVFYVAGYRKKVVFENLRHSFPDKSEKEIATIAKAFYHHLADMLIESLKAFSMTEAAVVRRYRFNNTGFLDDLCVKGRPVICVAGHYGNWEWG